MRQPIPDKLSTQIDSGVKQAITKAIERHRKVGASITIWHEGKVVTLTANQIAPLQSDDNS